MAQYFKYKNGNYEFRDGIRNGYVVTDVTITLLGFNGIQNVDWKNITSRFIPTMPRFMRDKLLFFGVISDIVDGHLPNQIGIDYITVTGSAGSETYTVPNIVDYKNADKAGIADYLWFKYDGTQRTVTKAELISYDFNRTLIKYDNNNPNTIRSIGILRSDAVLSEAEINALTEYFKLYEYWSGTLNEYGVSKDNRSGSRSVWIRDYIPPISLTNGTLTSGSIPLTWVNVESGLPIEVWSSYENSDYSLLFTTANDATTYTDNKDLFAYTSLKYKLRVKSGTNYSPFTAEKTFSIGTNLMTNGGAAGATDFVDSNGDGLADGLAVNRGTTTIVTGNGFVGNAQRVEYAPNNLNIYFDVYLSPNFYYLYSFKLRSGNAYFYYGGVQINGNIGGGAGNPVLRSGIHYTLLTQRFNVYLWATGVWGEFDEIIIRKITIS